jgi:hypothetical protein
VGLQYDEDDVDDDQMSFSNEARVCESKAFFLIVVKMFFRNIFLKIDV